MCWMLFQEVKVQKGAMQIRQVIKLKGMETSDPYEAILANNVGADGLDNPATTRLESVKKPEPVVIPKDFLCSISLELMRDPVIVATGQV